MSTAKETTELSVVILGGGGVGKSCITVQFVAHSWDKSENYDPTIEDTFRKTVQVDNTVIHLTVLDTAGQDEFAALVKDSMVKADGFIFVYDLTSTSSFQKLQDFVKLFFRIKEEDLGRFSADPKTKCRVPLLPFVLVGNKLDLITDGSNRKVTPQMAQDFALNILTGQGSSFPPDEPPIDPKTKKPLPPQTFPILEASAKTRTNIDPIFEECIRQALKWRKYIQELRETSSAPASEASAPSGQKSEQTSQESSSNSPSQGNSVSPSDRKKEQIKAKPGLLGIFAKLKKKNAKE